MPFSNSGYGTSPYGVGTPATSADPPEGPPVMSRFINPATRKPEINEDTRKFRSMPSTRQRVLLIAMTIRGSSSVLRQFGISKPDKVRAATLKQEMRAEVSRAYDYMTRVERSIRIDDVVVNAGDFGRVEVTIVYTDLTTRQADQRVSV